MSQEEVAMMQSMPRFGPKTRLETENELKLERTAQSIARSYGRDLPNLGDFREALGNPCRCGDRRVEFIIRSSKFTAARPPVRPPDRPCARPSPRSAVLRLLRPARATACTKSAPSLQGEHLAYLVHTFNQSVETISNKGIIKADFANTLCRL
jgi:hypothetical protein